MRPSYNIAPTNQAPVLYRDAETHNLEVRLMQFSLLPFWAKDRSVRGLSISTFNAKKETLVQGNSKVWSPSVAKHRCIIPVQGYYEWLHKGQKIPYYVHPKDEKGLIFLAGLWSKTVFKEKNNETVYSFAIITGKAPKEMQWLHKRIPIMLTPGSEAWSTWLENEGKLDVLKLTSTLEENLPDGVIWHEVSTKVNNARNEGAELIQKVDPQLKETEDQKPKKRTNDITSLIGKNSKKRKVEGEESKEVKSEESKDEKLGNPEDIKSEDPQDQKSEDIQDEKSEESKSNRKDSAKMKQE